MTDVSETIETAAIFLREAIAEDAAARRAVICWSRFAGPGVWREGHASDVEKISRLRRAKWRIRAAQADCRHALEQSPTGGSA